MNENLLITNFKKTKRQEENYTTEAFASLLRYLVANESQFAWRLINLLTQRKFNLKDYNPNEVVIRTQVATSLGRPDIEIVAPNYLIYIENKIEARMEKSQIQRYKRALKRSSNNKTLLLLISKYRMKSSKGADCYIRWYQIAKWLEDSSSCLKSKESHMRVIKFLGFLHHRYLALEPATTRVSPSLRKYLQREGKDSLSFRPMKHSSELRDDPYLIPLRKLLNVMAFSIESTFPNNSFGFSNRTWGLKKEYTAIGFNIEFRYDFFIDINLPDMVLFRAPMRRHSIRNASIRRRLNPPPDLGHGEITRVAHLVYWLAQLKLTYKEFSFFTKSFDDQIKRLINFMKQSRKVIDKLDP